VRGALRIQVVGLLALAGAATGALAGLVAGVAWTAAGLPAATAGIAWGAALAAAALDAFLLATGHPRPLALQRQVPVEWGRLLPPRTTAVLYGARLGVGPLTILRTWTWWAAVVVAAAAGPWVGAAVGATFAVARTATMEVAVRRIREGTAMSRRVAGLRRAERRIGWAAVAVVVLLPLAACGDDGAGEAGKEAGPRRPVATTSTASTAGTDPTIRLEPETTTTTTPEDATLQDLLIDESLPGFVPAGVDVLDLEAAAQAEVDPEAERALLETRRFERGVARRFINEDDDVVYVAAYEFGSPRDAQMYLADGIETVSSRGATAFDVEVPDAYGFTTREPGFTAHAVAFTRADRWFLVLVGSDTGARTVEEVRRLAAAQWDRAPREP
jgi:hypothetical protein